MTRLKTILLATLLLATAEAGWTTSVPIAAPQRWLQVADRSARPVQLAGLRIDSRLVGRLARSTIELTLHNPNNRDLEGELQLPLLDGQQVTAFALDFNGKWRDAVPVEKAKGRQVFEDVTRARIDPALLESTLGNNFKLRVYPIPAHGHRKVSLTITEHLATDSNGKALLRLSMPTTDPVGKFELHLLAPGVSPAEIRILRGMGKASWRKDGDGARLDYVQSNYAPGQLLEFALAAPTRPITTTEEKDGQRYFYTELKMPEFAPALRPKPTRLALVWDASGSGATRKHDLEFALLDAYFKAIGDTQVNLVLARNQAESGGTFPIIRGDWSRLRNALEQVAYDGATDPAAFLPSQPADAVLLFSDGLANFGANALPDFSVPLLAVSASTTADVTRLRHAANMSGGTLVDLLRTNPAVAVQLLREAPPRIAELRSKSARHLVASTPDAAGRVAIAGVISGAIGDGNASVDVVWKTSAVAMERQVFNVSLGKADIGFAAQAWARLRLDSLEPEFERNKSEIRQLGKQFGLVTRETSLIVLDRVDDYVRYDIAPPAELRTDFDRLRSTQQQQLDQDKAAHLDNIVRRFNERAAWWSTKFPKDDHPMRRMEMIAPLVSADVSPAMAITSDHVNHAVQALAPAPSARTEARMMIEPAAPAPLGKTAGSTRDFAPVATISLKKWEPNAPYAKRLRIATKADLYRTYLAERPGYCNSSAFFLDAADIFFERNEPELAIRILSNLAEMNLENRHLLRILGYRLVQAKQPALAIPMLERVLDLAPDEPQSYRDLGLAKAAAGQHQKAVDLLYQVVTRPWHGRFPDVEMIALAELNAIVATAPKRLDTSAIDERLLLNLPLDLRAVLTWDADNTDIDLWVTDPNGERVFYAHTLSYQGGRISRDFVGGYGPEEFSLRKAKPGRYLVQAQFYGHRQQVVSGATTLQLHLFTGFGTAQQRDQSVTLRLSGGGEVITVGEFVVGKRQ